MSEQAALTTCRVAWQAPSGASGHNARPACRLRARPHEPRARTPHTHTHTRTHTHAHTHTHTQTHTHTHIRARTPARPCYRKSALARFGPTRAEPIGLVGRRRNRSAKEASAHGPRRACLPCAQPTGPPSFRRASLATAGRVSKGCAYRFQRDPFSDSLWEFVEIATAQRRLPRTLRRDGAHASRSVAIPFARDGGGRACKTQCSHGGVASGCSPLRRACLASDFPPLRTAASTPRWQNDACRIRICAGRPHRHRPAHRTNSRWPWFFKAPPRAIEGADARTCLLSSCSFVARALYPQSWSNWRSTLVGCADSRTLAQGRIGDLQRAGLTPHRLDHRCSAGWRSQEGFAQELRNAVFPLCALGR